MKNKILKSGKSAVSFVVAFAVLAVSLFIAIPSVSIKTDAAPIVATDTWDGTKSQPSEEASNKDAAGNILINNAEELAWVALEGGTATKDKSYKVIDNQVFDLAGMTGITPTSTVDDVKGAAATTNVWNSTAKFYGNFDGNGVIIYNMYTGTGSDYAGLFAWAGDNQSNVVITVKGIRLRASKIAGWHGAAGIIGRPDFLSGTATNVSDCEVSSCYIYIGADKADNSNYNRVAAGILGIAGNNTPSVTNCYVHDNDISGIGATGAFIGTVGQYGGGTVLIGNCIAIGTGAASVGPKAIGLSPASKIEGATYAAVYTDKEDGNSATVTVSATDMKGETGYANMPELDWGNAWFANTGYPEIRAFHTIEVSDNGDGTHSGVCTDANCDVVGLATAHSYTTADYDNGVTKCDCGAYIQGIYDTWDGTIPDTDPTTQDADGNYIIKTAEDLAWVALKGGEETAGKNYKVVAGSQFDLSGMASIKMDSTAAEVKAAGTTGKQWRFSTDEENGKKTFGFKGNFDGNGLIVYNLYSGKSSNAYGGLFRITNGGTEAAPQVIKNVKVTASHIAGYHNAGGIIGLADNAAKITLTVENCEVSNCYIGDEGDGNSAAGRTAGGIIGATGNAISSINNCFVHDNLIEGQGISAGLIGKTGGYVDNPITLSNSIVLGIHPAPVSSINVEPGDIKELAVYSGVYTDVSSVVEGAENVVYVTTLTGINGKNTMNKLDYADVWFANIGKAPVLRMFHKFGGNSLDDSTHEVVCSDCGIIGITPEPHNIVKGECTICDWECDHQYQDNGVDFAGDCTHPKTIKQLCKKCGKEGTPVPVANTGTGHEFGTFVAYKKAECGYGNYAYWQCDVCAGVVLGESKPDKMADTVDIEATVMPGPYTHTPAYVPGTTDYVYHMDDSCHQFKCDKCGEFYGDTAHTGTTLEPDAINPSSGHIGACDVCGWQTAETVPHTFGDDNVCDSCGYTCTEHSWQQVGVTQQGDCLTAEIADYICTICGTEDFNRNTPAPGHSFAAKPEDPASCIKDGVKAHQYCSVCEKDYAADADKFAGFDTALSAADLKIAKEDIPCKFVPVAAKPATCEDAGNIAHEKCSVCGKLQLDGREVTLEDVTIPAKGHSYKEYDRDDNGVWYFDDTYHWRECTICGIVEKDKHNIVVDETKYEGTYTYCTGECGYEFFEHVNANADNTVGVKAELGAFSKDVWTTITKIIDEDSIHSEIKSLLKELKPVNFVVYDISPDEEMAEGKTATISIKVPEDFGENVTICYVDVDGKKVEILATEIITNEKTGDRTAKAEVSHFSVYALVDLGENVVNPDGTIGPATNNGGANNGAQNGDASNTSPATSTQADVSAMLGVLLAAGVIFVLARKARKA